MSAGLYVFFAREFLCHPTSKLNLDDPAVACQKYMSSSILGVARKFT